MARGWSWINEEVPENAEQIAPTLNALAEEWSALHSQIEQEGWRRQAIATGEDDYYESDFDTEEEYEEFKTAQRQEDVGQQVRLDIIEAMLAHHGARIMRPYEHWNEDERYMEYMENR